MPGSTRPSAYESQSRANIFPPQSSPTLFSAGKPRRILHPLSSTSQFGFSLRVISLHLTLGPMMTSTAAFFQILELAKCAVNRKPDPGVLALHPQALSYLWRSSTSPNCRDFLFGSRSRPLSSRSGRRFNMPQVLW